MEWLELHWTLVVALQFALERGVSAIISVLVTIKLSYPSRSFNMTHCSRCLIPWGGDNAKYMMKLIEYRDLVATGFFLVLPLTGRLIINHGRDVERILKRRRISRKPLYFFVGRRNMKKVKPQSGGNESIKTIVKNGNLMLTCVNPLIQMMSGIRRWKLV